MFAHLDQNAKIFANIQNIPKKLIFHQLIIVFCRYKKKTCLWTLELNPLQKERIIIIKKKIHSLTSNPNIDLICFRLTSGGRETCPASKSFLCRMNGAARAEGAERLRVIRPNQYHEAKQFNKKGRREREKKKNHSSAYSVSERTWELCRCRSHPNSVMTRSVPFPYQSD